MPDPINIAANVAVFGSGPAGVSAAAALVETGVRVTMFDVGKQGSIPAPSESFMAMRTRDHAQWRYLLGPNFESLDKFDELSPKFRVPRLKYVFEDYARQYRLRTEHSLVHGSLAVGGLSNTWGSGVACFNDQDLTETPIRATDLAASYAVVAGRIGISGNTTDELSASLGSDLPVQPAPITDEAIASFLQHHRRRPQVARQHDVRIGQPRNAVITQQKDQREDCVGCGQCILGCARKAIYSAQFDLDGLKEHANFDFCPDIFAKDVRIENGRPVVRATRLSDMGEVRVTARAVVLACGAVGSGAVVLRSLHASKPVRLYSTPVAVFALLLPGMLGSAVPREFFGLSQLSFTVPDGAGRYAFGSLYASHGIPIADFVSRSPLGRASGIRFFKTLMPSVVIGMFWLHSKFSDNTLGISPDGGTVVVGGYADGYAVAMATVRQTIAKVFRAYGAWMIPGSFAVGPPCGDTHYAGTVPMRQNPDLHEADADGAVKGLPNVYVVDGAALAAIPSKPPTLTIMANADRVARRLARRLIAHNV